MREHKNVVQNGMSNQSQWLQTSRGAFQHFSESQSSIAGTLQIWKILLSKKDIDCQARETPNSAKKLTQFHCSITAAGISDFDIRRRKNVEIWKVIPLELKWIICHKWKRHIIILCNWPKSSFLVLTSIASDATFSSLDSIVKENYSFYFTWNLFPFHNKFTVPQHFPEAFDMKKEHPAQGQRTTSISGILFVLGTCWVLSLENAREKNNVTYPQWSFVSIQMWRRSWKALQMCPSQIIKAQKSVYNWVCDMSQRFRNI